METKNELDISVEYRTKELVNYYANITDKTIRSIEFAAHIQFIAEVLLMNLHNGISKENSIQYVRNISEIIITAIKDEVV